MIALDIPLLNLKSPYYVVQDADGDFLIRMASRHLTTANSATPSLPSSKSSSVPMAVCCSISVLLATVCRSIASTCSFAGSIPTNTATFTRFVPLRT